MDYVFRTSISPDAALIDRARRIMSQFAKDYGFDDMGAANFAIAVDHMMRDAIRRGNGSDSRIDAVLYDCGDRIAVVVEDSGDPFAREGSDCPRAAGYHVEQTRRHAPNATYEMWSDGNIARIEKMKPAKK